MSVIFPPPGSTSKTIRHLRHMLPPAGSSAIGDGKFGRSRTPRHGGNNVPAYVPPKDRIPYWNIAPGDEVLVKRGSFVDKNGEKKPYSGIVSAVDRERNRVWLRAADGTNVEQMAHIPKSFKHTIPRLLDPDNPSKGYTSNISLFPRSVHYSNVSLKLPTDLQLPADVNLDLKKGVYASRLTRSGVTYDRKRGTFYWKRYAIVPTIDQGTVRVHVPWKKTEGSQRVRRNNASVNHVVDRETWVPWLPTDPVFVSATAGRGLGSFGRGFRTSPWSEARHSKAMEAWQQMHGTKEARQKRRGLLLVGSLAKESVKAPPVAQAPSPSEQVAMIDEHRAEWNAGIGEANASASFAESDYLDLAPAEGPLSSADSRALPLVAANASPAEAALLGERDSKTGRLLHAPIADKRTVDTWPIELLMKDDLTNENGLKARTKRWRQNQLKKKAGLVMDKLVEEQNLQALRELKLSP